MDRFGKFKHGLLVCLAMACMSCSQMNLSCSGSCTDEDITTSVQVKIAADRCMSDQFIKVSTYDRVVTLSGRVSNPAQKRIVTEMARLVPGVKYVKTKLVVRPVDAIT